VSSSKIYGRIGQTPVLDQQTSVTERIYAISGVTPRGELVEEVYQKAITSTQVIAFLQMVLSYFHGYVIIIWDNASIHKSEQIKKFLAHEDTDAERLTLYLTPVYCPEYNPDEQVWKYLKSDYLKHRWAKSKSQLVKNVKAGLRHLSKRPNFMRRAFRHPDVKLLDL
jgi:putative transposase